MPPLDLSKDDLSPFSDLGTSVEIKEGSFFLFRNYCEIKIEQKQDGIYAVTTSDGTTKLHHGARSVLADATFADLPRIAENQKILLTPQRIRKSPVPTISRVKSVSGEFSTFQQRENPWDDLDFWLREQQRSQKQEGTDLLLIDGPAGVGKTTIIREMSLNRAENYSISTPLIFQIASRGRVLQNISDLIAFSLQEVRSNITINQLMPLMRHGLITLAIDGFDELSDPNGFETAWSGLNNLISNVRGIATFLLAGRETFVSADTILRQLKSFDEKRDRLASLSISDPNPDEAQKWLLQQDGWNRELLKGDFIEPIFTKGSYALRPFFLDMIAREPAALTSSEPPAPDLLSYLVDAMMRREAQKFVELLDPPDGNQTSSIYQNYVGRFLEEVARDLAENQAETIADDALDLLAMVAADDLLPEDQILAVTQRARTIVFLANDQRPGYVRFSHEQLSQHFLSREALRSVGNGEKPRYVRRNFFGRESLDIFSHVARGRQDETSRFLDAVRVSLSKPSRDRTNTNLAVLGIAATCAAEEEDANLHIQGIGINELHFPLSVPKGISIKDTTISILHAAGADLRNIVFMEGVFISTLEIDDKTILPSSMPLPQILVNCRETETDQRKIKSILSPNGESREVGNLEWTDSLAEILGRIDRYKTFWLRTSNTYKDRQTQLILSHPEWQSVYNALRDLDLVTVKSSHAASGARSDFIHFRNSTLLIKHSDLHRALMGDSEARKLQ